MQFRRTSSKWRHFLRLPVPRPPSHAPRPAAASNAIRMPNDTPLSLCGRGAGGEGLPVLFGILRQNRSHKWTNRSFFVHLATSADEKPSIDPEKPRENVFFTLLIMVARHNKVYGDHDVDSV